MRLIDKAATDPDPEEEEDEEGGKDMESGERTPNGVDLRETSLREQYSPGHGPLFNGSAHPSTARSSQRSYCVLCSSPSFVMVLASRCQISTRHAADPTLQGGTCT